MNTVETFIQDLKKALDNDCLWAALSLALTIPDICGKMKYPNDKPKDRYIKWFDEYLGQYEKCPTDEGEIEMPYISGELFFKLRCAFFHEGTNNVEGKHTSFDLESFQFIICEKNEFDIYADSNTAETPEWIYSDGTRKKGKTAFNMSVNIRRICNNLILVTNAFLKKDCINIKIPQLKAYDADERYRYLTTKNDSLRYRKLQINGDLAGIENYNNYESLILRIYRDYCDLFGTKLMQKYLLYIDNVEQSDKTLTTGYAPIITPIFKKYLIIKTNIPDFMDTARIIYQFSHELCHYVFYSLMDLEKPHADNEEEGICTAMSLCMLNKYHQLSEYYKNRVKNSLNEGYRMGYPIGESINYDCTKIFDKINEKVEKYSK